MQSQSDYAWGVSNPLLSLAATSTLPTLSYNTPFPASDTATHTYETPLNRPTRPFVTISCDDIANGDSVIANHTRSGSNTEASVYEEPLVSVPQYDSILGAQVRGRALWELHMYHTENGVIA